MSQWLASILFPGFTFFPLDTDVGNVALTSDAALTENLRDKQVLVVGGTSGIGRGIALFMARCAANVAVVGHSASKGAALVEQMTAAAPDPTHQLFKAYAADLLTVKGCLGLAEKVKESNAKFDYVIFTVGIWPDKEDPRTADGIDKVLALDLVARFVVLHEIMPLLNRHARVMSVLGSTSRIPPSPSVDVVKSLITGEKVSYLTPEMLASAGAAGDTWLQEAASRHPGINFIGTFPGIVATDLVRTSNTFPRCLRPILAAGQRLIALSPEECGRLHTQILVSPNAGRRSASYFAAPRLEGRETNPLAYDQGFRQWLWSFLEDTLKKHK